MRVVLNLGVLNANAQAKRNFRPGFQQLEQIIIRFLKIMISWVIGVQVKQGKNSWNIHHIRIGLVRIVQAGIRNAQFGIGLGNVIGYVNVGSKIGRTIIESIQRFDRADLLGKVNGEAGGFSGVWASVVRAEKQKAARAPIQKK